MALKGNLKSIRDLKKQLAALPVTASARIAREASPVVSTLARGAYDAGRTVYGSSRPHGVDGKALDLVRTGRARDAAQFTAEGTKMRTRVLPRYFKYLINGPRGQADMYALPNGPLPVSWRDRIGATAKAVLDALLQKPGAP